MTPTGTKGDCLQVQKRVEKALDVLDSENSQNEDGEKGENTILDTELDDEDDDFTQMTEGIDAFNCPTLVSKK